LGARDAAQRLRRLLNRCIGSLREALGGRTDDRDDLGYVGHTAPFSVLFFSFRRLWAALNAQPPGMIFTPYCRTRSLGCLAERGAQPLEQALFSRGCVL